ncbi:MULTISPECIES: PLP-dependent aminotransferase family protein [unclassified Ensifer]|uniref:aminotransferase-like domain-containing protein n=1 Tax=unclassified Ensifer TaxID=2633371 RepID=UPI0007092F65|nr:MULTISPECIES: PLP-dependent aminotransferase family protein [unclassified Ensifer]KQY75003.1 hypothetical protein ASD52_25445 [Ensifer sp. Root142]MBD9489856.1 PLP-dependent aminotransferase family protein [Ensifer sp. ENS11]
MLDYRAVADVVASEIASGKLPPGTRLQPQRTFAYERGIAVSTASRVYAELVRRGLVVGEVGRGTFVGTPDRLQSARISEIADAPIDLQLATSGSLQQAALMAPAFKDMANPATLFDAMDALGPFGPKGAGEIVARYLAHDHWSPRPDGILLAGGGRQAIACAMAAVCKPGDRIGVEPLTYPSVIRMAARLGLQLVPLEIDGDGVDVAALIRVHRAKPLDAIYIQPTIHNPLGFSMSHARRTALAEALEESGLLCIEDAAFAFLSDAAPLAAYAPERVVYVNSMQKRLGPGVGVGIVVAPPQVKVRIAAVMRAGGWMASSLSMHLVLSWISDGTAAHVSELKRKDGRDRQLLTARILGHVSPSAESNAFHIWLELPEIWSAGAFVSAAAVQGVAITPAGVFSAIPGRAPNAVRVAISAPPLKDLERGLHVIRSLLASVPGDAEIE